MSKLLYLNSITNLEFTPGRAEWINGRRSFKWALWDRFVNPNPARPNGKSPQPAVVEMVRGRDMIK
jgi:hypothetical protein